MCHIIKLLVLNLDPTLPANTNYDISEVNFNRNIKIVHLNMCSLTNNIKEGNLTIIGGE